MKGLDFVDSLVGYLITYKDFKGITFKYAKPETAQLASYIVVNNLPTLYQGAVQTATLNINIHCKDMKNGLPDIVSISTLSNQVINAIGDELYVGGFYFAIKNDSGLLKDTDNTHFINLQIECIYNNLKKV